MTDPNFPKLGQRWNVDVHSTFFFIIFSYTVGAHPYVGNTLHELVYYESRYATMKKYTILRYKTSKTSKAINLVWICSYSRGLSLPRNRLSYRIPTSHPDPPSYGAPY